MIREGGQPTLDADGPLFDAAEVKRMVRREIDAQTFSYHEGGTDLRMLCSVLKWCAGIVSGVCVIIVAGGIIAAVSMSNRMSALETEVTDLKATVDHVYRLVEPRYRGGQPDAPDAR